jgi:glycerol-1-phosphate dehydrogenase [NAD(P)+]
MSQDCPRTAAEFAAAWDLPMRTIVSEPGALVRLPGVVDELLPAGELGLVHDGAPKFAGTADLITAVRDGLADRPVRLVTAPAGDHGVVLDERTVRSVVDAARGVAGLISVGSGTVSDRGKAVAAELDRPLVAVQTAASVNGYADSLSVLVRNGAKRTLPTAWPRALVIDHAVVAQAPDPQTRSGVGDAVAAWVAPADWYLANALGLDRGWDEDAIAPVVRAAQPLIDLDPADPAALAALLDVLTVGGLAIGHTGSTAGLSGVEHLISHLLDMAAMASGTEHDLHGAQVGVATVLACSLWEIALQEVDLGSLDPAMLVPPADLEERVLASWTGLDPSGRVGAECWTSVRRKFDTWAANGACVRAFFDAWPAHEAVLRRLAHPPRTPAAALARWGAPRTFSALSPSVDARLARWALRSLPYMRDRFTLTDLLLLAGRWDDALIDRVLDRAAEAGGGL